MFLKVLKMPAQRKDLGPGFKWTKEEVVHLHLHVGPMSHAGGTVNGPAISSLLFVPHSCRP